MPEIAEEKGPSRPRSLSTPKVPVQERSIDRVERILDAAEGLVREHGTAPVTMQEISQRSGVGRASVYQFFPSILAVWRGLALRYLSALQAHFEEQVVSRSFDGWHEAWDALIDAAVDFYNRNPVAQSILLGSDGTQEIRLADPDYDKRYAEWISEKFAHLFEDRRAFSAEYLRIVVTSNTSLFSLSVWEHGRITEFYANEAKRLSKAYNEQLASDFRAGRVDAS